MKKLFLILLLLVGVSYAQTGTLTGYPNVTALKTRIDSIVTLNTRMLAVEAGKVAWSDSNGVNGWFKRAYVTALLNGKQNTLGFTAVPTTRTLTINSTSYDLSANRSWTISATVDTSGYYATIYDIVTGILASESGNLDSGAVNDLIATYLDTASGQSTHTIEEIDSAVDSVTILNNRVAVLENTVTSLQNSINNILAALDTCGCSASTADNTPPLAPTSYVAIGGTSQTQYVTTWTDPVASDLDSIRWYEGSSNDTTAMTWITSIVGGTETYTRTGRTANTTYWSAIKAVDDSGNVSYFSNVDSATTQASSGGIPVIESFTTDSVEASATITLTKPSGVQNGDLLLIVVASEDPTDTQQWNNTTNKPTGFTWLSTTIGGGVGTGQNDCQTHIAAFYRIADGSEGATVGVTSVGTGNDQVGYYLRLSGVYGASPIDVWDSPLDSTLYQQTDTIQIHSQTTGYDNELALVVCANDGGNYGLTVSGTGWSAVSDNWVNDSEFGLHLIIGKKDMPSAGATGQAIITSSVTTPHGSKVGMILTVRSQ